MWVIFLIVVVVGRRHVFYQAKSTFFVLLLLFDLNFVTIISLIFSYLSVPSQSFALDRSFIRLLSRILHTLLAVATTTTTMAVVVVFLLFHFNFAFFFFCVPVILTSGANAHICIY